MRGRLFYGWVMVAVAFAIILYLTAGWMAVAAGVVIRALRRSRPMAVPVVA